LAQAEVGAAEEADRWLTRAASVAAATPTPFRARQLAVWRGTVAAARGDSAAMREQLERAVQLSLDQGLPAPRCEILALLAGGAARLGPEPLHVDLRTLAERAP